MIHSSLKGKKIDFIKRNPSVSFNAYLAEDGGFPVDPTTGKRVVKWKSVICRCKAVFVEDEEAKLEALRAHLRKYEPERKPELRCKREVAIIKLEIVEMSGKQRPP
ncbi:MAG: pyridoxamine 5'-phosphate oxidase family protein [Candidatus Thorarchaeota archaeon]|nr:pyridoxamine 5'-phosphate oxidase family protein [Candidatus Thorarchaeota archaeon]